MLDISFWIPGSVVAFLSQFGGLLLILLFLGFLFLLTLRPFFLWYFRINEQRDYQKKQVELETKIAVELEALNHLMRMPLKKAAKTQEPTPSQPPSQADSEAFLEAIKKIRKSP